MRSNTTLAPYWFDAQNTRRIQQLLKYLVKRRELDAASIPSCCNQNSSGSFTGSAVNVALMTKASLRAAKLASYCRDQRLGKRKLVHQLARDLQASSLAQSRMPQERVNGFRRKQPVLVLARETQAAMLFDRDKPQVE